MEESVKVKKPQLWIMFTVVIVCILVEAFDAIHFLIYPIRTLPRTLLFVFIPLLFTLKTNGKTKLKEIFTPKIGKAPFLIGAAVYIGLLAVFFLLYFSFDFSNLSGELTHSTKGKMWLFFLGVFYISFINSFIEEWFFRYFACYRLEQYSGKAVAYFFSSLMFALYHITILKKWFNLPLSIVMLISLLGVGYLFVYLQDRYKTVFAPWIVHVCANLSILTMAFLCLIQMV